MFPWYSKVKEICKTDLKWLLLNLFHSKKDNKSWAHERKLITKYMFTQYSTSNKSIWYNAQIFFVFSMFCFFVFFDLGFLCNH